MAEEGPSGLAENDDSDGERLVLASSLFNGVEGIAMSGGIKLDGDREARTMPSGNDSEVRVSRYGRVQRKRNN